MKKIFLNISAVLLTGIVVSACSSLKSTPTASTEENNRTSVETTTEASASTTSSTSTNASVSSNNVKTVNTEQFSKLLLLDNVQVLDVRTTEEYQSGHIEDAINIDVLKDDFKTKAAKLDKDKPVLVYCRSGKRSMKAATTLESMGFKRIVNLDGGMLAWEEDDMPVEK